MNNPADLEMEEAEEMFFVRQAESPKAKTHLHKGASRTLW